MFRNKTFFFFDYAGLRETRGLAFVNTVPTAETRVGDFSNYRDLQGNLENRELARGWLRENATPEQLAFLLPEDTPWDAPLVATHSNAHALCACSVTEFTLWQQHMRGALSQLPMASGPWIWRPSDAAQRPAQMSFLEGLQAPRSVW